MRAGSLVRCETTRSCNHGSGDPGGKLTHRLGKATALVSVIAISVIVLAAVSPAGAAQTDLCVKTKNPGKGTARQVSTSKACKSGERRVVLKDGADGAQGPAGPAGPAGPTGARGATATTRARLCIRYVPSSLKARDAAR